MLIPKRPSDYSRISVQDIAHLETYLPICTYLLFPSFFKRSVGNWVVGTPLSLSGTVSLFHQTSFRFYIWAHSFARRVCSSSFHIWWRGRQTLARSCRSLRCWCLYSKCSAAGFARDGLAFTSDSDGGGPRRRFRCRSCN